MFYTLTCSVSEIRSITASDKLEPTSVHKRWPELTWLCFCHRRSLKLRVAFQITVELYWIYEEPVTVNGECSVLVWSRIVWQPLLHIRTSYVHVQRGLKSESVEFLAAGQHVAAHTKGRSLHHAHTSRELYNIVWSNNLERGANSGHCLNPKCVRTHPNAGRMSQSYITTDTHPWLRCFLRVQSQSQVPNRHSDYILRLFSVQQTTCMSVLL